MALQSSIAIEAELNELLVTLSTLRREALAEGEQLFAANEPRIMRDSYAESARNLTCYLALRRRDLRSLQIDLMRRGLSSLGRSEGRVMPSLDATLASLAAICRVDDETIPLHPTAERFDYGERTIDQAAETMFGPGRRGRDTRIMVTMPTEAASDPAFAQQLVSNGVECIRINCAHDNAAVWQAMIEHVRAAEREAASQTPIHILMDLGGPKIRTVRPASLSKRRFFVGDTLLLVRELEQQAANDEVAAFGCTLPAIHEQLRSGAEVWIDDGKIGTRIRELTSEGALLEVIQAGPEGEKLRNNKGLNFPDTDLEVRPLTTKDLKDLDFVARHADMVGYSFVQTASDVALLQEELQKRTAASGRAVAIVLKIETRRAVRNMPELLLQSAGGTPTAVMIARGDLAVELGYARIAEVQEELLWLCEAAHVPVIWATQVLEQLAKQGRPSRAEVTDAAMSDRAECVMLNKGPFIFEAVALLDDVLLRMQAHQNKKMARLRALRSWADLFEEAG
jgi:pyruvate kinase